MRYHIATGVYKKFSILSIALIFALTSVSGAALSVALSKIVNAAGTPSIIKVDSYYVKEKYKGVATDITVDGLTDVSNVEVSVNRSGGAAPITKTSKASVNTTLSTGTVAETTAPIIIQHGTYSEADSSSWNPAPAWASASTPVSVTVKITYAGGVLTETDDTISETKALLSEVIPSAPSISSPYFTIFNHAFGTGLTVSDFISDPNVNELKIELYKGATLLTSAKAKPSLFSTYLADGQHTLSNEFKIPGPQSDSTSWDYNNDFVWNVDTQPTSAKFTLTGANGTVTETVTGYNVSESSPSANYHNILAATPPAVTINAPTGIAGNSFTVNGTAQSVNKLNRVYVQLVHRETSTRYGGTTINLIPKGVSSDWSVDYDATKMNLPEGTYAAHVSVTDMLGGTSSSGWTANFKLDKTAPTFAIVSPANNSTVKGTQSISAIITDANDIKKLLMNVGDGHGNYTWEEGKASKITRTGNTFHIDIDTNTLPNGVNHVVLRATDGAGNTRWYNNNAATRAHSYKVDNAAPEVAILSPANESPHNGSVAIRGKVKDNEDNLRHYYIRIDRQTGPNTWSKIHDATTKTSASFNDKVLYTLPADAAEGRYRVQLSARDNVGGGSGTGNRSDDVYSYFVVDKTNPVASSIATDRTLYGGTFSIIQVTGAVNDENIASYRFTIDGTAVSSGWTATAGGNVAASLGLPSNSGSYTVLLEAQDKAGNIHSVATAITVDKEVDVISSLSNNDLLSGVETITANLGENGTIQLTFLDEDDEEVTVSGTATLSPDRISFRFNTTQLENGEYTLSILGTDELGNTVTRTIGFEVFNAPYTPNRTSGNATGALLATATDATPVNTNITLFNNNIPLGQGGFVAGAATTNQQRPLDEGQVKAASTNSSKEKEIVEAASSNFAWYWILLLIAVLVAAYYAYRNWKLSSEK